METPRDTNSKKDDRNQAPPQGKRKYKLAAPRKGFYLATFF